MSNQAEDLPSGEGGAHESSPPRHMTREAEAAAGETGQPAGAVMEIKPALFENALAPEEDTPAAGAEEEGTQGETASDKDEVSQLSGKELDEALAKAEVDASQGGSNKDGSMNAEEKRNALREAQSGDETPAEESQ